MAVTRMTLKLQQQLVAAANTILDVQQGALVKAWADAFDEIAPDLNAALMAELAPGAFTTRSQLMRSPRLSAALAQVLDRLTTLTAQAGIMVTGDLQGLLDQAAAAQTDIIASQLPEGSELAAALATAAAPDVALDAIVRRSTQRITSRLRPLAAQTHQVIRRELIRGVAAGSNPRQTAARMVRRTQDRYNFSLARALVIARTETLDAHRAAAQASQALHVEVLAGWAWLAKLDEHTCRSCWAQAGHVHPLEEPGPEDHPQGRCSRMPITKTWRELGFDIPEPPSAMPAASTAFDQLPTTAQRRILGRAGHAAWKRGEFPMSSWSRRVENPDWRPSYTAAPPPAVQVARKSA